MVCPNCKSDEIIVVQNQHFCINCGQMVPESAVAWAPQPAVKVQSNGLPEGVKILPLGTEALKVTEMAETAKPESAAAPAPVPASLPAIPALIHGRSRFGSAAEKAPAVAKRRKPGRPKAGRLDIPQRVYASTAPAPTPAAQPVTPRGLLSRAGAPSVKPEPVSEPAPVPAAKLPTSPLNGPTAPAGPRRLNDLAPRRPVAPAAAPASALVPAVKTAKPTKLAPALKTQPAARPKRHVHRVTAPALHYGPVLAFSLRARARPRLVALAAFGALSLGAASAYGAAQLMAGGLPRLADGLIHAGPKLIGEAVALALVYYIGRSLGQTAIVYGISREADQRPVTLSRQFGIAVNTFGRRLRLDLVFGLSDLIVLSAFVVLFVTGGRPWPVNINIQIGGIFASYLVLLYLWLALALARGLAGVNLAVTTSGTAAAARLGWQLFSHRLELIGPRFTALLMEIVLSVPLLVLVVALIISVPTPWHPAAILGAGVLAWLAGSLLGVGTAAWWAMLYRALVTADRPEAGAALLSSRQPEDARRWPLSLIVAGTALIIAAALILPWLSLV
ncbi:MAG: hypothetical protein NVSMB39_3520 [Candidatus Saccharimonadales bacterium]